MSTPLYGPVEFSQMTDAQVEAFEFGFSAADVRQGNEGILAGLEKAEKDRKFGLTDREVDRIVDSLKTHSQWPSPEVDWAQLAYRKALAALRRRRSR